MNHQLPPICRRALSPVMLLACLVLSIHTLHAGVPVVRDITVTDVTTRSFSVVWQASEPSTASLIVCADATCTAAVTTAVITPHPVVSGAPDIRLAAEDMGVMKVQVIGLLPNTEYFFQTLTTSKSTSDETISPTTPEAVTTEAHTTRSKVVDETLVPFSNDLMIFPSLAPDGINPALGALVMVSVAGASHPLTGFVGDGIAAPNTLIDMNNVFDMATQENLDLSGDEVITLEEFRGLCEGAIGPVLAHLRRLPLDDELSEVKTPAACFAPDGIAADFNCDGRVDLLDFLQEFLPAYDHARPDCAFNNDFDLVANNQVDLSDFFEFLLAFGESEE